MTTVGLTLKRVFNEVHDHLQNTVLTSEAPPTSALLSSLNMPSPPVNTFRNEVKSFLEHFKHVILLPLSWWLTVSHFILSLTWTLMTLPLRVFIGFYEREVRRKFPWLPSIWGTMTTLFPQGIKIPTLTSLTAGPYKGEGPTGPDLPTLDNSALLDSIINGDSGANGVNNANGSAQGVNKSKLESALRKIPDSNHNDLDGALADVKASKGRTGRLREGAAIVIEFSHPTNLNSETNLAPGPWVSVNFH
ncbi:hypothetical protein F5888DRAFT_1632550 [Russula emetica]|nr:hypothetical protein F5888DRAFT_1632550 [Russula emetica]